MNPCKTSLHPVRSTCIVKYLLPKLSPPQGAPSAAWRRQLPPTTPPPGCITWRVYLCVRARVGAVAASHRWDIGNVGIMLLMGRVPPWDASRRGCAAVSLRRDTHTGRRGRVRRCPTVGLGEQRRRSVTRAHTHEGRSHRGTQGLGGGEWRPTEGGAVPSRDAEPGGEGNARGGVAVARRENEARP
jgi:hypothetical protein